MSSGKNKSSGGRDGGSTPSPAAAGNMMTIAPFMPGMQGLLASQLAQGFGGDPSQYMQSPLFQPMSIPNYAGGAPLVPKSSSTAGDRSTFDDDRARGEIIPAWR